jgi:hypothetical protein
MGMPRRRLSYQEFGSIFRQFVLLHWPRAKQAWQLSPMECRLPFRGLGISGWVDIPSVPVAAMALR